MTRGLEMRCQRDSVKSQQGSNTHPSTTSGSLECTPPHHEQDTRDPDQSENTDKRTTGRRAHQIIDQGGSKSRCDQEVAHEQARSVSDQVCCNPSNGPRSSGRRQVVMESVIAEGKGLMRKACSGERRGGEDDRSGDGDTRGGRGGGSGSGSRGGDFDGDGSGGGVGEGETGREEEARGLYGRTTTEANRYRADVGRTEDVQVRPLQSSNVQKSVRCPEKEHLHGSTRE